MQLAADMDFYKANALPWFVSNSATLHDCGNVCSAGLRSGRDFALNRIWQ